MNRFETVNPATEEKLNSYNYMTEAEILSKIEKLDSSYQIWKNKTVSERVDFLVLLKDNIKKHTPALTLLVTQTMGKPLIESKLEIEKSISQIDYYIEKGPEFIRDQELAAHYPETRVDFLPMGIIFSVMPWNYPVWQFFRFAVGAWLSGNVILFKHSEITTAVALFFETLIEQMQGPLILQSLIMAPEQSEIVFAHKSIRAVTFTGSSKVGRTIGELSGRYLKKSVLELGGNDAFVIDATADIKTAVQLAVQGRLTNNGQSCIASKRFFVPRSASAEFMKLVDLELKSYVIGNPLDRKTKLGPLAHKKFFDQHHQHLKFLQGISISQTRALGWEALKGYFVSPYFFLLDRKSLEVKVNYQFFQEQEIFSPIGMVTTYDNDDDLYSLVNESPYGLGCVWIGDKQKFKNDKLHLKFNVGMIAVNDILKSDARVPFGGTKDSGIGRESGAFGIKEFCNVQSLGIK